MVRNGALFGFLAGLMVLSKFSSLVFFPASAGLALIWYWWRARPKFGEILTDVKRRLPSLGLAILSGCLVIWAGYRFSIGKVSWAHFPMPAPEFWAGLEMVRHHNEIGHLGYLLGSVTEKGVWYFFWVALFFKTPLGLLALMVTGGALAFRRRPPFDHLWLPLAFSMGVMIVGMFTKINIGIRHVLPVYVGCSILAAFAALHLLESGDRKKWMLGASAVLCGWFGLSSLLSHPDYLAYFNELAGSEPEKILVDSDMDWGQDQKRLAQRLKELGVQDIAYSSYIVGNLQKELGFPRTHTINKFGPMVGWNAVSVGEWKELRLVTWPDKVQPLERVGKSILLYNIAPPPGMAPVPLSAPLPSGGR
jgi:hypothetical protein